MPRFLIWSDLHDEIWNGFQMPDLQTPVDGVLIAGDTHTMGRHLDIPGRAARIYNCPVVVIWGNHELYGSIWPELRAREMVRLKQRHKEGLDVRVLHADATEIAGVRIIGATLWTDLKLYPPLEFLARSMVSAYIQDYRKIYVTEGTRFTIGDMLKRHAEDKAAIFEAMRKRYDGSTIVMTHHLPIRELICRERAIGSDESRALSAGFASALWDEIRQFDIHSWIWGHSHEGEAWDGQGDRGLIRFITNQRGYPGEDTLFDPAYVIEV